VLDPACGSGHFLLYAFDLLAEIYQEAWDDPASPAGELTGASLRDDYPERAALNLALPGLILAHNLHGVDIDARCAQIAQLALWMRAQRAFRDLGVARSDRPMIRRSNIVIAEPMPGEADLRDEFLESLTEDRLAELMRRALDLAPGQPVRATKAMAESLAGLVEEVWDRMRLAGEMGVLLRIEKHLERAIARGRNDWEQELPLFRVESFDFWNRAERLVLTALEDYADAAGGAGVARRRLFAEDAAHGFALVDMVSKRFDAILMNPPFGLPSLGMKEQLIKLYPQSSNDIYAVFVERSLELLEMSGRVGAITSRTGFFLSSYKKWRENILLERCKITAVADLGSGVLDANVETAAYCLERVK
jgi:hypothetical protein